MKVRKTTLRVLTHLILNDMVKVKGQISDVAERLVDDEVSLRGESALLALSTGAGNVPVLNGKREAVVSKTF